MSYLVVALLAFIIIIIVIIVVAIVLSTSRTSNIVPPLPGGSIGSTTPSPTTITIANGPFDIRGGSTTPLATIANPGRKITSFSATLQDLANPPIAPGINISLHDGPTIFSPLLATLSTISSNPTTVSSPLSSQPTSSALSVFPATVGGSRTDIGRVSNIQIQVA